MCLCVVEMVGVEPIYHGIVVFSMAEKHPEFMFTLGLVWFVPTCPVLHGFVILQQEQAKLMGN